MNIRELLKNVDYQSLHGAVEREVSNLTYDSRQVTAGSCFFAIEGVAADGHNYINSAVEKGATVVICKRLVEGADTERATHIVVEDTDKAMALVASNFYGNPSRKITVVGVTGTNGKTTIATLLYDLVRAMGHKAGLISTVVYKVDDEQIESTHTTPDTIRLNAMLAAMVERGCEYCFMECSSHAIVQRRIYGIHFAGALFTNLTHDHLDYHKTFAEYIRAKKIFFDELPKGSFAIVNCDDRNGEVMLQNTAAKPLTLSIRRHADYTCKIMETTAEGMMLRIDNTDLWVGFLGRFNAYNLLTVYAAAVELGLDKDEVMRCLTLLHPVDGRFDIVHAGDGTTAIIDYAHTPDALENILKTVGEIRTKNQSVTLICGCGGERDKTKRPEMAQIAVKYSDRAIFTSDNPRSEEPEQILRDMEAGVAVTDNYMKIVDRDNAIKTAVMLSSAGDIIVVAGKGHECYQIIGNQKFDFNDKERVIYWFSTFNR
ncbi:MAG: UDP-N-acetylmuramoyl-L-alanyl-D-glutamate--2,6-diaminopimelate ligase [Alistipes sp.]|nr:UDP-N-acetylmuramoyl-L-alanyl-D-glutamate--2,6-diaminopimelate ligase [Alistipes sp.]